MFSFMTLCFSCKTCKHNIFIHLDWKHHNYCIFTWGANLWQLNKPHYMVVGGKYLLCSIYVLAHHTCIYTVDYSTLYSAQYCGQVKTLPSTYNIIIGITKQSNIHDRLLTSPCSCRHKLRPAPVALAASSSTKSLREAWGSWPTSSFQWRKLKVKFSLLCASGKGYQYLVGQEWCSGYWGRGGNMNDYNNHVTIK